MQPGQKLVDTGFLAMLYLSVIIGIYQIARVFIVKGLVSARFLHFKVLSEKYAWFRHIIGPTAGPDTRTDSEVR